MVLRLELNGLEMTQGEFPHGFDPTNSILFLGAGFSTLATNIIGGNPPTRDELDKHVKLLALLPEDDPSTVLDIATYAAKEGKDLFSLLCNLYTIKSLSPDQTAILSQPWLRIYTTNYDDAVEVFWKSADGDRQRQSYSTQSQVPTQFRPGSVVHLHGYIHECTQDSLLQQLVLSHYSYAQQRAILSPWWDVFERDVRIAKNVFFVGYDLGDFEPAKYLTKNPSTVQKTHFILRPVKSPVAASRLDEYGRRDSMAVSGFAKECKACVVAERIEHANALNAFWFVDLLKDHKVAVRPTPSEIQSLFTFGKFNFQRLLSTFPDPAYAIPRADTLKQCLSALDEARTLIVHSKVGNGKTTFGKGLAIALSESGHSCFEHRENVTPTAAEIEFIGRQERPIVIFPDYETAYLNMHLFSNLKPDARFVVEIATGTLQVRYSAVVDRLLNPIQRVDINRLNSDDCKQLYTLLNQAGIAPTGFNKKFRRNVEMRDVVISVFEKWQCHKENR
jgi:hypothetical protein